MVGELVVLGRIERFQQGRGGVAPEVRPHLINLVQDEHGVARAGLLQALQDATREGADVRPAVAANLGLVADAAERDPNELAAQGAGDALAQTGLADAGWADKADDGAFTRAGELAHGQELQHALFDFGQAVVVFVQDGLGGAHVQSFFGLHRPGQRKHRVQIGPDDHALGDAEGHFLQPVYFFQGALQHRLGHLGFQRFGAVIVHLALAFVALAKFLLDGLHLLAQKKLALGIAHLFLDPAADVLLDLENLKLFGQQQAEFLQALPGVQCFEKLLLDFDAQGGQVPGDMIGQGARLLDAQ